MRSSGRSKRDVCSQCFLHRLSGKSTPLLLNRDRDAFIQACLHSRWRFHSGRGVVGLFWWGTLGSFSTVTVQSWPGAKQNEGSYSKNDAQMIASKGQITHTVLTAEEKHFCVSMRSSLTRHDVENENIQSWSLIKTQISAVAFKVYGFMIGVI